METPNFELKFLSDVCTDYLNIEWEWESGYRQWEKCSSLEELENKIKANEAKNAPFAEYIKYNELQQDIHVFKNFEVAELLENLKADFKYISIKAITKHFDDFSMGFYSWRSIVRAKGLEWAIGTILMPLVDEHNAWIKAHKPVKEIVPATYTLAEIFNKRGN